MLFPLFCRGSSIRLFVSKLIQVVSSIKELLSPSNQHDLANVIHNFMDALNHDSCVRSAIECLLSVVRSVADGYKQVTGDVKQADLVFSLLKDCFQELYRLEEKTSQGTVREGNCVRKIMPL